VVEPGIRYVSVRVCSRPGIVRREAFVSKSSFGVTSGSSPGSFVPYLVIFLPPTRRKAMAAN